jgi:hypothetical protein
MVHPFLAKKLVATHRHSSVARRRCIPVCLLCCAVLQCGCGRTERQIAGAVAGAVAGAIISQVFDGDDRDDKAQSPPEEADHVEQWVEDRRPLIADRIRPPPPLSRAEADWILVTGSNWILMNYVKDRFSIFRYHGNEPVPQELRSIDKVSVPEILSPYNLRGDLAIDGADRLP